MFLYPTCLFVVALFLGFCLGGDGNEILERLHRIHDGRPLLSFVGCSEPVLFNGLTRGQDTWLGKHEIRDVPQVRLHEIPRLVGQALDLSGMSACG